MKNFTNTQLEEAAVKADKLWAERPSNTMWNFLDCVLAQFNYDLEDGERQEVVEFLKIRAEYPNFHKGEHYKYLEDEGEFWVENPRGIVLAEFEHKQDMLDFNLEKATYVDGDYLLVCRSE
jgi:hypothetical protein